MKEAVLAESHRGWQLVRREWRFPPIIPVCIGKALQFVAHMTSDWRAIVFWLARRQRSTVVTACHWLQGPELAERKPEKGPHHVFSQNRLIQKASYDPFGVLRIFKSIDGKTEISGWVYRDRHLDSA